MSIIATVASPSHARIFEPCSFHPAAAASQDEHAGEPPRLGNVDAVMAMVSGSILG